MDPTSVREVPYRDALVGLAQVVAPYQATSPPRPTRPVPAWEPAPVHLEIVPAGSLVGGFVSRVPARDPEITRLYAPIGLPLPAAPPSPPKPRRRRIVLDSAAASVVAAAAAVATRLS